MTQTASSVRPSANTPPKPATEVWKTGEFWLAVLLIIYLLIVACGATAVIISNFTAHEDDTQRVGTNEDDKKTDGTNEGGKKTDGPNEGGTNDKPIKASDPSFLYFGNTLETRKQILILLALCGGIAGSFIHAAQSLVSFLGNKAFKPSWAAWYFLRPWIGGVVGMAVYFTLQAGLMGGGDSQNAHGVVALGLMGGWFSKIAADKLQEVFETMFKNDEDKKRADPLEAHKQPILKDADPNPAPSDATELSLIGLNFAEGAVVVVDDEEYPAIFESDKKLRFALRLLDPRPANKKVSLAVKNPKGTTPLSDSLEVTFE